jgi:O-antigen/teichoic acid export membrane protein
MLKAISRNFAAQGLGLLVSFLDRFVAVGVLLRSWGPETYSAWVVLLSCAGLLSLGELGLNIYYGNVWRQAWANGNAVQFARTVSVALFCSSAVAVTLAVLGMIVSSSTNLPVLLSVRGLPHWEALAILYVLGAATVSRIARGGISQIYRGREAFAAGTVVDLASPLSFLFLTIFLVLLGAHPIVIAGIYLVCDLAAGWGFMVWDLLRRWPDLRFKPVVPTRAELVDITRHVKWLAIQMSGPVAWLQMPIVILGYFGYAGTALVSFIMLRTLVNFSRTLGINLSISSGIETAAAHYEGKHADVTQQLLRLGSFLSAVTAAMAVGIILFGEPLIRIWAGHSGLFNGAIAAWLIFGALVAAPSASFGSHLIFTNSPRPASVALLSQFAIGIVACWILAAKYGPSGAAAGLTIGEVVGQGILLPALGIRYLTLRYWPYLLRCMVVMIRTALWCGATGLICRLLIADGSLEDAILVMMLWGLFGLIPALLLAIPARERVALLRALRNNLQVLRSIA